MSQCSFKEWIQMMLAQRNLTSVQNIGQFWEKNLWHNIHHVAPHYETMAVDKHMNWSKLQTLSRVHLGL